MVRASASATELASVKSGLPLGAGGQSSTWNTNTPVCLRWETLGIYLMKEHILDLDFLVLSHGTVESGGWGWLRTTPEPEV